MSEVGIASDGGALLAFKQFLLKHFILFVEVTKSFVGINNNLVFRYVWA